MFSRHLTFSAFQSAEVKDWDCLYHYLRENVAFKIDCLKLVVNASDCDKILHQEDVRLLIACVWKGDWRWEKVVLPA